MNFLCYDLLFKMVYLKNIVYLEKPIYKSEEVPQKEELKKEEKKNFETLVCTHSLWLPVLTIPS